MEQREYRTLSELLEKYRAEYAAEGLMFAARKIASVRNLAIEDVKNRKPRVVPINEGRPTQPGITIDGVRQIR